MLPQLFQKNHFIYLAFNSTVKKANRVFVIQCENYRWLGKHETFRALPDLHFLDLLIKSKKVIVDYRDFHIELQKKR